MARPGTVAGMGQPSAKTTGLACSADQDGRVYWRFVSSVDEIWTQEQEPVVEAYQCAPGRSEVYTLPTSRTDIVHVTAPCDLDGVVVELVGQSVVVSGQGVELARVPTRRCEAAIGECGERNCRICYPLSWQQGDEPMRYWTVIFELTYGGGTVSIERVEAHNEAEAREKAVLEAFDDYDPEFADHFWSKNAPAT